jgi:hypothetical protein
MSCNRDNTPEDIDDGAFSRRTLLQGAERPQGSEEDSLKRSV